MMPMGGMPMGGGMPPPSGPAAAPLQPAVPGGMQPMDGQQQQIMDTIKRSLQPEELQVIAQCMTPELAAILVKLFGPNVGYLLTPLMAAAQSTDLMDSGDNIGGIDDAGGYSDMPDDDADDQGYNPMGSVSSPLRGIRGGM